MRLSFFARAPMGYSEQFGEDFQRHMLAVLSRTPGAIQRYRTALDHTYFSTDLLRALAKALLESVDAHRMLPTKPTLRQLLREQLPEDLQSKGDQFVGKLFDADVSDADAVLAKVVEFGRQQALINAVIEAADKITAGKRDAVMPLVQKALMVGEDLLDLGIDYAQAKALRDRWYDPEARAAAVVPTGMDYLDLALAGGLGRGELGVFLGPPKVGKTSCLVNVGYGAITHANAQPLNVIHYTCELSADYVGMRYDDRLCGNLVKWKHTDMAKFKTMANYRAETMLRGGLVIKGYPTRTLTPSMIRAHVNLLTAQGHPPDILIIDYADIMRPERRLGELRHEVAGLYEDLRSLAGEFNVAVWTGSQAKKEAMESPVLTLAHFAEAFEKSAVIDVGIGFCQTDDERMDSKCRLVSLASRRGESGWTVECRIDRKCCLLQPTALYDASLNLLAGDGEGAEHVKDRGDRDRQRRKLMGKPSKHVRT